MGQGIGGRGLLGIQIRSRGLLPVFLSFIVAGMYAQESAGPVARPKTADAVPSPTSKTTSPELVPVGDPLPRSFRGFRLGMALDELKAALAADEAFAFRGDRDVSLLSVRDQTLIETTGFSFVRRAFFQLKGGSLFLMAFDLDAGMVDHYSVFSELVANYGEPASLDPRESVWLSGNTRVSLERPLTVKYMDRIVLEELASASRVKESRDAVLRKEFLDGF